jgi:hypothetical protein
LNIEHSTLKEGLSAGRQQHVEGSSAESRPTLPNMPTLPVLTTLPALSTINSQPSTGAGVHGPHATAEARLAKAFWKAIGKTFRGEIWENTALVPMGRGYANDGKVFDIESACYLKPVQRAIRMRPYGKFVCLAAVQMLKTFGAIEEPAGFFIEHVPGDMTIYLSADTSAFDQAKSRLMPRLKSIPGVRSQIEAAEAANRFDITTAEFYLPGMVLRVWPLNETTTQRITLRYVLISDAFLSGRTGLIKQAIRRTTQHNTTSIKDYKVVIESQGGEDGDDFDEEWKSTNMQFLHVVCPMCGEGQPFEWHREREEGFLATLPREKIKEIEERIIGEGIGSVEPGGSTAGGNVGTAEHSTSNIQHSTLSGEHPTSNEGLLASRRQHIGGSVSSGDETAEYASISAENFESCRRDASSTLSHAIGFAVAFATAELSAGLLRPERRHAGMKRGAEDLIKLPDGGYNEAEVLKQTYYECFHCGSAWPDTPAMRRQIDQSSYYVPSNPSALWENVGFSWPSWAGQRLAWGGEFNMLGFLRATKTYEEKGNVEPLRQWYQKSAARPWSLNMAKKRNLDVAVGSYETDPLKLMPDFHSRDMTVDAQKDLKAGADEDRVGSFWFVVRDWDKFGNSRQVARGFAESWEQLLSIQKFWKVPNQRFCIDASKWGPQIEMQAAMNWELVTPAVAHPITGRKDPYPSCWRLFYGDKRAEFRVEVVRVEGRNGDGKRTEPSAFSEGQPSRIYHTSKNGIKYAYRIFRYRWSNISFEMQMDAILARTQGMVRFESLPREGLRLIDGKPDLVTLAKEVKVLTYDQQMSARYLTRVRGVNKYEDIANREAHYRDCELMQLVRASQDGLLGHVAAVANAKEEGTEQKGEQGTLNPEH